MEDRDDDDNESAVRALNTAFTQQAYRLKDLHDDPLMSPSDEEEVSTAPFDEHDAYQLVVSNTADDTDDATSVAPPITGLAIISNHAAAAASINMPSSSRIAEMSATADGTNPGGDACSGGDNDADDGIHDEMEQLRVSELLLRRELENAEGASSLEQMSTNLLEVAARVWSPDDPPTALELRAHAHHNNKDNLTGLAFAAEHASSIGEMNMDFVEGAMGTMIDAVLEGCHGYLQKAQAERPLFRQPDSGDARPEDESASEASTSFNRDIMSMIQEEISGAGELTSTSTSSSDTSDLFVANGGGKERPRSPATSTTKLKKLPIVDENDMPQHIEFKNKRTSAEPIDENNANNDTGISKLMSTLSAQIGALLYGAYSSSNDQEGVDVEAPSEEGHEVEAFYQAKQRMTIWQRAQSRQQHQEWKNMLLKKEWRGIKRLYWIILLVLVLTIILLGVIVAVIGKGSSSKNSNMNQAVKPTKPKLAPYNLGMFPSYTQVAIRDPDSPQHQAYQWLVEDPAFDQYSDERKMQRFALAALYYSTNGPEWVSANRILTYDTDECQWFYTRSFRTPPAACAIAGGIIERLMLDNNNLQGSLPAEIFLLTSLRQLSLANNKLMSTIPDEGLANMTKLEFLDLSDSGLSGPIPSSLGSIETLQLLDLSANGLTGSLPQELSNLANLTELRLQRNGLNGTLPGAVFSNLGSLQQLYLFKNSLEGPIPSEIGELSAVEDLFLYENHISSSLPTELGQLSLLQRLWLDRNSLTGTIPRQLGSLEELIQLNLFSNALSGTIPPALSRATSLEQVRLGGNQLTGSVPDRLCAVLPVGGDNTIVGILSVDCEEVACDCDCTCTRPDKRKIDPTELGEDP